MSKEESYFLDDAPIEFESQDHYNRRKYVARLASYLLSTKNNNGLVVGVTGPWGSGKTSVKNLLQRELRKEKKKPRDFIITDFNPWMFTGTSDLVSLFFQSISSELHPHVQKAKERAVAQADKVEFVSNLIPSSKVLKHLSLAFGYLSNALKIDDSVDALRKAQKKVRKELNKAEKRIFVFIDDIDRLSEKEVDELFSAIKALGQFPYVTYILFYDQTVVEKALEQRGHIDGKEYLKRIVQVPVRLPDPSPAQIFDVAVDELCKESPAEEFPQNDNIIGPREKAILENCLRPYMATSRDVNRFMNEFRFRYSLVGDEVAFGDLVGITALEVFDMPLWNWIAQHKQLLSFVPESSVTELFSKRLSDARVDQLQSLLGDDSELAKNSELWGTRKNALSVLFPAVDRALDEHSLKSVVKDEQYRFICFPNYVDSYFELEPPVDRFTQKDLHSLLFDVDLSEYCQTKIVGSAQFADYILTQIMNMDQSRIADFLNYFFTDYDATLDTSTSIQEVEKVILALIACIQDKHEISIELEQEVSCDTIAGLILTSFLGASAYIYSPTRYDPPIFGSKDYRETQRAAWPTYQTARMDSQIYCKDEEGKQLCFAMKNICLKHLKLANLSITGQMNDGLFQSFIRLSRTVFSQEAFIEFIKPINIVEPMKTIAFVEGLVTKSDSLDYKTFRVDADVINGAIGFKDFDTVLQDYRLSNLEWNEDEALALGAAYLALRDDEYRDREIPERKIRELWQNVNKG